MRISHLSVLAVAAACFACSPAANNNDAGPGNNTEDSGQTPVDAGSTDAGPSGHDGGSVGHDAGTVVDAGPMLLNCNSVAGCEGNCSGTNATTCLDTCAQEGSTTADGLVNTLQMCFETACPQTDGGVCAGMTTADQQACQTCVNNSATDGGPCVADQTSCSNDTSGVNNCAGLLDCCTQIPTCESSCTTGSSQTAITDVNAFLGCLNTQCGTATTQAAFDTCINNSTSVLPDGGMGACVATLNTCEMN